MALTGSQAYILAKQEAAEISSGVKNWHIENGTDIVGTTVSGGKEIRISVPKPTNGKSIQSAYQDSRGRLVCVLEDGTELTPVELPTIHGKSAYEVAVQNGYTGTEAEWLETLHGDRSAFEFTQNTAKTEWRIQHNLNDRYPSVKCFDDTGSIIYGDINYYSANLTIVTFSSALKGRAIVK